mmetsp:Transcript_21114/g.25399  ORF Transcript_21114/g.25399 Transcript_21114/m.25399 type:complete len:82 (+) Transcript_21114:761-1006(+)
MATSSKLARTGADRHSPDADYHPPPSQEAPQHHSLFTHHSHSRSASTVDPPNLLSTSMNQQVYNSPLLELQSFITSLPPNT